jgi:hypothetical protein
LQANDASSRHDNTFRQNSDPTGKPVMVSR